MDTEVIARKTEKITINLGLVDLGQIDLLVQEGFYTNRTDFIRTAIRTQLAARGETLDQTAARRTLMLGSCHYTRRDLEEIRDTGQMIHIRVLGLASIAADVSPIGPGHDCLSGGARRLPGPRNSEGCSGGSHRLNRRDHSGCPDRRFPQHANRPARRTVKTTARRDTAMDARQMAAIAQATRLTHQGRLVEATALIQQTLASPVATRRTADAPYGEEETASPDGGHADPPPALRAREGTRLRLVPSGWFPRRRALPSRGRLGLHRLHRPASPAVKPPAGRFDAFSYSNAAGTRGYRLYVPAGHTGGPLPLIVMLHGGTQDAATFAAATGMNDLAEREKFLVAYPEQARSANAGRYWNWFVPGHQCRNAGSRR